VRSTSLTLLHHLLMLSSPWCQGDAVGGPCRHRGRVRITDHVWFYVMLVGVAAWIWVVGPSRTGQPVHRCSSVRRVTVLIVLCMRNSLVGVDRACHVIRQAHRRAANAYRPVAAGYNCMQLIAMTLQLSYFCLEILNLTPLSILLTVRRGKEARIIIGR
jgi:hypothetical protein